VGETKRTRPLTRAEIANAVILLASKKFKVGDIAGLYNISSARFRSSFKKKGMESPGFYKKKGKSLLIEVIEPRHYARNMARYRLPTEILNTIYQIMVHNGKAL
jgi:hypothetical protein